MNRFRAIVIFGLILISQCEATAQVDTDLPTVAQQALRKSIRYYSENVSSHGGYVYYTSLDLKQRWGEGVAEPDTIFVQPPGTPTVGLAYLTAYQATQDPLFLKAAKATAQSLLQGQLQSGGWAQVIHFQKPKTGRMGQYRTRPGGNWNMSSLDDNQTQAALSFLIQLDQELKFQDKTIHEAVTYGLQSLLKAQFANGAFPQGWREPVPKQAILKAKYPDYDWKTENRVKNYWDYYTLNDNLAGSVSEVLILAHQVYQQQKYLEALKKLGDFLILAQMPEPQPGWCQQYNYDMYPIWARKFEPPAITGSESQDVMRTLIRIANHTGDAKYFEPIPKAIAYFAKSTLPNQQVARYYEFKTNKPLYMNAKYQLTYDDAQAPSHYSWKQSAKFDSIERLYQQAKSRRPLTQEKLPSAKAVKAILAELDTEGRWVSVYAGESLVGQPKFERGFKYLSSAVFSKNIHVLSAYIQAARPQK